MRRFNRKTLFVLLGGLLVLGGLLSLIGGRDSDQRTISVTTDLPPLRLELNDSTYSIGNEGRTISVPPAIYHYRASAVVEGRRVTLTDTLDLTKTKNVQLNLNYLLYNKQSVAAALCAANGNPEDNCLFTPQVLRVAYLEDNQWAAVFFTTDTGEGKAVLRVESGHWKVVAGPGSDIPIIGYYPQSVEEALQHEN